MQLNWEEKLNWGGPDPLVVNIIASNCCTRVPLYAKMLKETETEEAKGFFCYIFIIGNISIGGRSRAPLWLRLWLKSLLINHI